MAVQNGKESIAFSYFLDNPNNVYRVCVCVVVTVVSVSQSHLAASVSALDDDYFLYVKERRS